MNFLKMHTDNSLQSYDEFLHKANIHSFYLLCKYQACFKQDLTGLKVMFTGNTFSLLSLTSLTLWGKRLNSRLRSQCAWSAPPLVNLGFHGVSLKLTQLHFHSGVSKVASLQKEFTKHCAISTCQEAHRQFVPYRFSSSERFLMCHFNVFIL